MHDSRAERISSGKPHHLSSPDLCRRISQSATHLPLPDENQCGLCGARRALLRRALLRSPISPASLPPRASASAPVVLVLKLAHPLERSSASHVHCCLVLWQAGDGVVSVDKLKKILDLQGGWSAEKRTMQTVLLALRAQLRSKTLPKQQPAEGATYT